jgi:hypothetical protein
MLQVLAAIMCLYGMHLDNASARMAYQVQLNVSEGYQRFKNRTII